MGYSRREIKAAHQLKDIVTNPNAPDIGDKISQFKDGNFGHEVMILCVGPNRNIVKPERDGSGSIHHISLSGLSSYGDNAIRILSDLIAISKVEPDHKRVSSPPNLAKEQEKQQPYHGKE